MQIYNSINHSSFADTSYLQIYDRVGRIRVSWNRMDMITGTCKIWCQTLPLRLLWIPIPFCLEKGMSKTCLPTVSVPKRYMKEEIPYRTRTETVRRGSIPYRFVIETVCRGSIPYRFVTETVHRGGIPYPFVTETVCGGGLPYRFVTETVRRGGATYRFVTETVLSGSHTDFTHWPPRYHTAV